MTGAELKKIRIDHKLTRPALAAIIGYNANYLYRLEQGKEDLKVPYRMELLVKRVLGEK